MLRLHRKLNCDSLTAFRQALRPRFMPRAFAFLGLAISLGVSSAVVAGDEGFSGGVTPSRFEIDTEPGQFLRRSIKIYNLSSRPQQFNVKTVEWDFSEEGQLSFSDALGADSCRPWVKLERHRVNVVPDPRQPRNFRFEVQVPESEAARECRFAIMIENLKISYDNKFAGGSVSMPVTGRIAVIVYLGIGDVEPEMQIKEIAVREINSVAVPVVQVQNRGDAHGRLDADLVAVDANGQKARLGISNSPVLPWQTRYLPLSVDSDKKLAYPLTVKGKIYADEKAFEVNTNVDAKNLETKNWAANPSE